ncbi:hypothetical protein PMKS-002744 [Pichia membranifaciens]|uniref:Conserved oligomeric Golgi complex subunit 4 n=1 Tax=Pichia membranifaciens TaxID=4926 RepID=A0A1Q2YI87_9ASCO|nr:hypothetical protein PMKS-002744 [Pichia membranifaciens]
MGIDLETSMPSDVDERMSFLVDKVHSLDSTLTTTVNIKQLSKLLNDIKITQNNIDSTLQTFTTKNTFQHQSTIRSLEISRVGLSTTLNHSRNLKSIMDSANSLSYKITERVRLLDSEKSQLDQIKCFVDNVNTLKLELLRAHDAIARQDWLIASRSISIIRQLPEGLLTDPYVEFKVPTTSLEELPSVLLANWIRQLTDIFVQEFNDAAAKRDVQKLTYFFQLFPLIGKDKDGLRCYSKFICGIISDQSRLTIRNVQNKESRPEFYAQLLFRLYQTISGIVNQHSKVIRSYYGKAVVNNILKDIQMECDLQSNLIYETYADSKHLDRFASEIQQYGYPVLIKEIYKNVAESEDEEEENDDETEAAELTDVSQVTDELSAMMNHWAMYSKFFVVVWNEFLDGKGKNSENNNNNNSNNNNKNIFPPPLIFSSFGVKIHDRIIRQFDLFCTYAIRRTLEKACTIESLGSLLPQFSVCLKFLTLVFKKIDNSTTHSLYSLIPEDPAISSLADDIIIVLNTILLEVLATGELTTIKNMVSNIKRILLNDFLNIIQQRLKGLSLKSSSNLLTKNTIQKIHQQQNPLSESAFNDSSISTPSRSSTPVGINVSASDIANTGSLFMRSLNAAISYTMAGEGEEDLTYLTGDDTDIKQYVIYLNTLAVMNTYLDRLMDSCLKSVESNSLLIVDDQELTNVRRSQEETMSTDFDMKVPSDESIHLRIGGLLRSIPVGFSERANSLIESNVRLIFERVLKTRIVKLVNESISENYLMAIEEGQYYSLEKENPVPPNGAAKTSNTVNDADRITRFIKNWNSLIIPYATTLSNSVFNRLITKIVDLSAMILENKVWQLEKKVSAVGAIKLEQDLSTVIGELTKFNYGLRSAFIKVTQIIMVVGLDEEEDVTALEDIGDEIEWALTPSERTRARRLRG